MFAGPSDKQPPSTGQKSEERPTASLLLNTELSHCYVGPLDLPFSPITHTNLLKCLILCVG